MREQRRTRRPAGPPTTTVGRAKASVDRSTTTVGRSTMTVSPASRRSDGVLGAANAVPVVIPPAAPRPAGEGGGVVPSDPAVLGRAIEFGFANSVLPWIGHGGAAPTSAQSDRSRWHDCRTAPPATTEGRCHPPDQSSSSSAGVSSAWPEDPRSGGSPSFFDLL